MIVRWSRETSTMEPSLMMRVSARANRFPDSPIRKLAPLADAAIARGVHVHSLNIGQPDVPTPQPFLDALHAYDRSVIAYGRSEGEPAYREALSDYYRAAGIELNASDLVVTVGGSEALLFALQIVAEPGDEVLCFEPFYTNYNTFAMMSGVTLRPLRTDAASGFHLPDDQTILSAITPRTKAILICSPNNPTGTVLTEAELRRLARVVKDHGLFIISDEVYREFVYEGTHTSILHIEGIDDHAILVDSISKRYSACGARIGCLATRNKEVRAAAVRMAQGRLCPPVVEQAAALAMTRLGPGIFGPMREEYMRRRDITFEGLQRIPGLVCEKPQGAFYIMAELPIPDCEAFARWLLTDFSHNGETLMVAPGPGFYVQDESLHKPKGLNQVRLAYVLEIPKLKRAMDLLARAVDQSTG